MQAWPWPVQHWPRCGLQERAKILAEKESAHREKEALIEKIELQLARREKRLAKEKVRGSPQRRQTCLLPSGKGIQ